MTIEELKDYTKFNVTDSQLDTEIEERDMILLAPYFKVKLETLSVQLGLSPAAQQDVKDTKLQYDNQTAVDEALRLWRKANPGAATYRALVEIVLRMGVNGTAIAEEVCNIAASTDGKYIISLPTLHDTNLANGFEHPHAQSVGMSIPSFLCVQYHHKNMSSPVAEKDDQPTSAARDTQTSSHHHQCFVCRVQ